MVPGAASDSRLFVGKWLPPPKTKLVLVPLMGLIFFSVVLAPFAAAYAILEPRARSLASLLRFYCGSLSWPLLVSAGFTILEVQNVWLDGRLRLLSLLAPVGGVLLDRVWRQFLQGQAGPRRLIPVLSTSALLMGGFLCHFVYLESLDLNPTFSGQSLVGTWKGREDELVLTGSSDWSRKGDWVLVIHARRYRVVRSFGQLCLAEDVDPDGMTILYRKVGDR